MCKLFAVLDQVLLFFKFNRDFYWIAIDLSSVEVYLAFK